MTEQKIKPFVRMFNTDLVGEKPIIMALQKVQGISFSISRILCKLLNIPAETKAGTLTDEQIKEFENIMQNPGKKMPKWLLNRQKDFETGEDKHLHTSKLRLTKEFDIKRMRKIKTYKGIRHSQGQPVRGQRTRAHFRKGGAVGVSKKKAPAGKAGK